MQKVRYDEKAAKRHSTSLWWRAFPAAASSLFLIMGLSFVPLLGMQNDEAFFAVALLPPRAEAYALGFGQHRIPLMLMSYLGALKSVLYRPLIRAFGTGVWAVRVPVLVMGAASVWLVYMLLRRMAGERAAIVGCGLLATDAVYLLTTCFDWGPVVLQHLLVMGGVLLIVRFVRERRESDLAGGFFLFGLALWDKALAEWMLTGMAAAAALIFPRQVFGLLTRRRAGIAGAALVVGALPLLVYNGANRGATLHGTAGFRAEGLSEKIHMLQITADGSGLFNEMIYEDWQTEHPHAPQGLIQRASASMAAFTGQPHHWLLMWSFGLALVLAPLARGSDLRLILLALLAITFAWLQMAFGADTGKSVHHTILMWPFPEIIIAVSFASASRRLGRAGVPILAVTLALVMGSGLLLLNQYHAAMVRNGGMMDWTDAIFRLSAYLKDHSHSGVFPVDWGMKESLRLLNRGRLPLTEGGYLVKPALSVEDREAVKKMISIPDHIFLTHIAGLRFFPELDDQVARFAGELGYRHETVTIIADSYGRPTFELYRFVAAH